MNQISVNDDAAQNVPSITKEVPKTEEEEPIIITAGGASQINAQSDSFFKNGIIRKVPKTFNDYFASRLVGWCVALLFFVWLIEFAFGIKDGANTLTGQLFEVLKTIVTAGLGYLFGSRKSNKD